MLLNCNVIWGFFVYLADLGISRSEAGGLEPHGAASAPGREYPDRRVRHPLPLPADRAGTQQRAADRDGKNAGPGNGSAGGRSGSDERNAGV